MKATDSSLLACLLINNSNYLITETRASTRELSYRKSYIFSQLASCVTVEIEIEVID